MIDVRPPPLFSSRHACEHFLRNCVLQGLTFKIAVELAEHPIAHACNFTTDTAGDVRRENDIFQREQRRVGQWWLGVSHIEHCCEIRATACLREPMPARRACWVWVNADLEDGMRSGAGSATPNPKEESLGDKVRSNPGFEWNFS